MISSFDEVIFRFFAGESGNEGAIFPFARKQMIPLKEPFINEQKASKQKRGILFFQRPLTIFSRRQRLSI